MAVQAAHDDHVAAPAVAPAPEVAAPAPVPALTSPDQVIALQRTAGNTAVTGYLARFKDPPPAAGPRLRTALDSKLRTERSGDGYSAILELEGQTQSIALPVAEYHGTASTPPAHLPVYLEDVVSGNRAVVNIRFDPDAAAVRPEFQTREVDGIEVEVRLVPSSADELSVGTAAKARRVHGGVTVSGGEKVTEHEGASATDKVMGSVASAEGGFATVEGSDKGVLTWGQGQWTVTAGELQRVLAFIKSRRPDLFDRYWGAAGLDVGGGDKPDFIYEGKPQGRGSKTMMALFRPSIERVTFWAGVFAQAGMDPQIQRLQREYMRGEVEALLAKKVGGRAPHDVLDTRGQAFYYSMDKNLPSSARSAFQEAIKGLPKDGEITGEHKARASKALEDYFKNSSVVAHSKDDHHIIAFWGEGGRKRAIKQADDAIAAGGDATWSVEAWKAQKARMEKRQSRYQKTKHDIDVALARQNVEPDVPEDLAHDD